MSDLEVDPPVLRSVGSTFATAGDQLSALDAGTPLADAAAAVPQLATAGACRTAQTMVEDSMKTLAQSAGVFGDNLGTAAGMYERGDITTGEHIASVGF